jgi:3-phenylpropionate/cinnamic acid dioxygenase small subunit
MPVSSQVCSEIQQFLIYEALLMDHCCLAQWSTLLARDVNYSVCNCSGREIGTGEPAEYVDNGRHLLLARIQHRARTPDSRFDNRLPPTRRFVTNVSVTFARCPREYDVISYQQVSHISHEGAADSAWSAERRDRLRATDRSFAIARREVLIDSIHAGASVLPAFI